MKDLNHPNIIEYQTSFMTVANHQDDKYVNIIMNFMPCTVKRVINHYHDKGKQMPLILAKVYAFQMFRALNYLSNAGVCHRDIKPQNLLVDPQKHLLKICDFGSALKP